LFSCTFLYAIGFVGNFRIGPWNGIWFVPKSMDVGGEGAGLGEALLIDALLLGVFALQHSGMARRGFKQKWTKLVPRQIERSTYVLFSSAALALVFWLWRPIGGLVWAIEDRGVTTALVITSLVGWAIALSATFHINHFELFGLRQTFNGLLKREPAPGRFVTPGLYRLVRHPLYTGFIIAFWATPVMTIGHLVFAIATTGYILVAIQLEERDLVREYGDTYERYRRAVPMLAPVPKRVDVAQAQRVEAVHGAKLGS
jgi:protein-S-isoprenylcysteine O-methyltransferase Ste14